MKNRERGVNHYDLMLECKFRGLNAKPIPMEIGSALNVARSYFLSLKGNGAVLLPAGTRQITLEDWVYEASRDEHYLVMSCADPDLSDVSFKNMQTGASRMAGKHHYEAIDKSCHLLIKPDKDKTGPALMLQTSGSGVSADKICSSLGRMLRGASELPVNTPLFERNHPDATQGKKLKILTHFEHRGHQSQYLEQILKTGRLEGIELISETYEGLDDDKGYAVTSRMITVEVVDAAAGKSLSRFKKLISSTGLFKNSPPNKARIHFRESETGTKQSHLFNTNDLEQAFSKRDIISFDTDIHPKYVQVSMTVIDKMRELL